MGLYVIAIDYYGHGLTPIPAKDVSLYHVADDIHFLLQNLKIKKAIVGGWSRGGAIATAFYDAYPESVLGLILEDGGSVAWSVNDHKKDIDTLTNEIRNSYQNRPPQRIFTSDLELYQLIYKKNFTQKNDLKLRKETYSFLARAKQDTAGSWKLDPGVSDFVCLRTADQLLTLKHRPLAGHTLFGISTEMMNPRIIYRNLDVPMLIYDPVSENDWFAFEAENRKLQLEHPDFITLKVYEKTGHAVKDERTEDFYRDLSVFVKDIIRHL
jgi:pimeloyl-ACP methyl ester carboxylesterase